MRLIAITGGIGAGKSVVSRILLAMGFCVYDCDSRAKSIMDSDDSIKQQIKQKISSDAIDDSGVINRGILADVVFNDKVKLEALNAIVHKAVRDDIVAWHNTLQIRSHTDNSVSFVETAILYQSGLDKMVEEVWVVTAPVEICIDRVCKRNNITAEAVISRINSQQYMPEQPHSRVFTIVNDGHSSLLKQIDHLLKAQS